MSDRREGDGWWLASDGRWYPPQPPPFTGAVSDMTVSPPTSPEWWQHPAVVGASLACCFPVGLALTWLTRWTTKTKLAVTAVVAVLVAFSVWFGSVAEEPARIDSAAATSTTSELPATTTTVPTTTAAPTTVTTAPPTTVPPGFAVTGVVDGDTLDIEGGARVRLIGIDTPEVGEAGYSEATVALSTLVAGKRVMLITDGTDDVDRYGRLLRYVEVDGVDVNAEMLRSGHARSRYDSRDGYGRHDREDAYVAADAEVPDLWIAPPPPPPPATTAPPPPAPPPVSGGTDPRFGTCREAKSAGYGPYISGIDVEYGWYLDADGDGTVCE